VSSAPIKIAVIGVGHLGKFHVEHLLQIPEAELVGFFDVSPEATAAQQERHALNAFDSLDAALSAAEALSVVVPTKHHYAVASRALEKGLHVFIEKPIAPTLEEADKLLRLAEENDRIVQVGHIERLNPAIQSIIKLDLNPRFIEGHRLAPFASRGTDVPVVLDLMIHDIDVVLSLVKSPVESVRANGVAVITDSADIATARLEFANGAVANLTASRISQKHMRKLRLFQSEMYISIDYQQQLAEIYRLVGGDAPTADGLISTPFEYNGRRRNITYEKPAVESFDPLHAELTNFVRSITGQEAPVVDGYSARAALDVASRIQEAIVENTGNETVTAAGR